MDDRDAPIDVFILLAIVAFTIVADACGAAFLYKVWNERKWRITTEKQTVIQERIAIALERTR